MLGELLNEYNDDLSWINGFGFLLVIKPSNTINNKQVLIKTLHSFRLFRHLTNVTKTRGY